ncbi:MAG TPA: DUF5996 family protein [Acidobacteriaceae bacterium]|jgi:hypothetical protein|nr:DUF5996 family protein [Acidobacteriaceae bacterium]
MANASAQDMAATWPELGWEAWKDTATTLHMWTQIVGKTRLALTPLQNHWWNVPLYVSARGLTTSAMPWRGDVLEVEFDFREHVLELRMGSGASAELALRPQSVAAFFAEYEAALVSLGVEAKIWPMPVEVIAPVRFDLDTANASYDCEAVTRFHQVLMRVDAILKRFATGFQGKISPVHFFWGSFDLCCTRFSGRVASGPARADAIQREAYSHEVISAGWWPGNGGFGEAAFYCYAAPVPEGLAGRAVRPGAWDAALGEFILRYDELQTAASPEDALMGFLETTYAAGADAAKWDRVGLERAVATAPCR